MKVTASFPQGGPGGAPIDIEVSGDDMPRIEAVARQIYDIVRRTDGIFGADLSWREGRPEVQAHIDRDRAAQYGISVAQIASALHTSLEGDTTSKYRENGKEYDIRVSLPKAQRSIVSQVPDMVVGTTAAGQPVYLYEVVRMESAGGPTKMQRANRQRTVTLTAQLAQGYALGNVQQELIKKFKPLDTHGVAIYLGRAGAGDERERRQHVQRLAPLRGAGLHAHGRALRIVHLPAHHLARGAAGDGRRLLRPHLHRQVAQHHVHDRHHHAGGAGDEKCHPARRLYQYPAQRAWHGARRKPCCRPGPRACARFS